MRNRFKTINPATINRIGNLYNTLRQSCVTVSRDYGPFDSSDLFHDTILQVSGESLPSMNDREFIDFFRYRFGRVQYQDLKDLNAEHRDDNLLF
jgi:hypothetical protein